MPTSYDVIIVGGGPAGLSAALMLGRACRRIILIDAGEPRNGSARQLHGFLGRDGTEPRSLLHDGRSELAKYQVEILEDRVISAESAPQVHGRQFKTAFQVATSGGHTVIGRKLLFATGVRDEVPDLPGFRECYGVSAALGCHTDAMERGRSSDRQATRIPGLFLAGDADGDVQFAIVAAAEGATAAVAINRERQDEDRA